MAGEAEPPPRQALRCPTPNRHSNLRVREDYFYCRGCAAAGNPPRHQLVYDTRRDRDRPLSHTAFVQLYGTDLRDW